MKYEVHIDRLVVDRSATGPTGRLAAAQAVSQAVQRHIAQAAPNAAHAAHATAGLEPAIGTALQQAMSPGRRP